MGPWALFADPGGDGGGEMGTGWVVALSSLVTVVLAGLIGVAGGLMAGSLAD